MSRKQIDDGLNRYYRLKGVVYYRYHHGIGMFSEWCQQNGYDSDTICIELQKQPQQCKLTQFDPYFPAIKEIGYRIESNKKQIFQIIKICWNDLNAFKLHLIFHEKTDPNKYIFDNIQKKRCLWFDGYLRQNDEVYISLEIVNMIRMFFEFDMESLYIPHKIERKRSHYKYKYTQKLCNIARKLEEGEYFIAYNIFSTLISVNIDSDYATIAALYYYRAIILRRWNSLINAERDIKLSIKYQSKGISIHEYGKILFAKRQYHKALEKFIDAITLTEKENDIKAQIKCHISCCRAYEKMEYFHNARVHYLRIIALKPNESSYQYRYAKYIQRRMNDYDKAAMHYTKAIELNPDEYIYRYDYGRMLVNHTKEYRVALEQLLIAQKIKADESKCGYLIAKCYDALRRKRNVGYDSKVDPKYFKYRMIRDPMIQ